MGNAFFHATQQRLSAAYVNVQASIANTLPTILDARKTTIARKYKPK